MCWTFSRICWTSGARQGLEGPPHENQERAGLVAIRARDRAELQIGESVDVAAFDRERARRAETGAATDYPCVTGRGTIGRGAGAAPRPASQLEGDLRAGIRVGRDTRRRKQGAQEDWYVDVVELALVGRGACDAALRIERFNPEPQHVAAGAQGKTGGESRPFRQIPGQDAAVRYVPVRQATLQCHAALCRGQRREPGQPRDEAGQCACHGYSPPFCLGSYTRPRGIVAESGCAGWNGHVFRFHDQTPKARTPSISAPSPHAMTCFGVVAKMKIHPSNAKRLGSG